jgi:NitT/TauT family transport system permease protein|tara:strand:- start:1001 stop:1882 length:882 start_codon:yes stop_codon:yes gene_type:complete
MKSLLSGSLIPITTVLIFIFSVWYVGTILLNSPFQKDVYKRKGVENYTYSQLVKDTMSQKRPVLPPPHQVIIELWNSTVNKKITSKRSLVYHAGITLSSTLLGFVIGSLLGIILAVAIVYSRTCDMTLMPWIITSQTIPILAIAPMIIVVLSALGIQGLLPKAFISTYLSFFPVTISMVKGLRSPETIELDMMKTWNANGLQTLLRLRLPSSVPFLFAGMKIGIAAALVGAIIGELPTGAVSGLGARMLQGSYYGQMVQIWSALIFASLIAALLVTMIDVIRLSTLKRFGQLN